MKTRQDAWTEENDLLLAETVLRHIREGSTQLNAFEEVGDELNRTSAACGFRWNAVVRNKYLDAIEIAKKQRKDYMRNVERQSGKAKTQKLYEPGPDELYEPVQEEDTNYKTSIGTAGNYTFSSTPKYEVTPKPIQQYNTEFGNLSIDDVIGFLNQFRGTSLNNKDMKTQNERLKKENNQLNNRIEELERQINKAEQETKAVQEDYQALISIMDRARKMVLFEEDDRQATKFKMDKNGNLEKIAK